MEINRAAILSAMYQDDDDDVAENPDTRRSPMGLAGHVRRIRVGAVEYEVPSVEYVQQLEHMVAQQVQTVLQQRRLIDRMASMLMKTRNSQAGHSRAMDELRRELAKKITQRDFTGG
jgi:hypothetical protein